MLPYNRLILIDFIGGPRLWAYCIRQIIDIQCGYRKDVLVMAHRDLETNQPYEFVLDTVRFDIMQEVDPSRNERRLIVRPHA